MKQQTATICLMKPHHAQAVAEMDLYFNGPNDCYTGEELHRIMTKNKSCVPVIAHLEGRIIGFHIFCVQKIRVYGVRTFVHPEFRERGIGGNLLKYQHHHFKKVHSYTLKDGVDPAEVFIVKQDFLRSNGYYLDKVTRGDISNPTLYEYVRPAKR